MTLSVIFPQQIGESNIVSSNVALEIEYLGGFSWNTGDIARVGDTLYQALVDSAQGTPTDTNPDWTNIGPANRYAAFDRQYGLDKFRVVETATSRSDSIEYTLDGLQRISAIAFFGLVASSIQIVATDPELGEVLNVTYELQDQTNYNGSLWAWFFVPASLERKYINLGVNIPAGATINVTISNPGGTAVVSSIVLGLVYSFGTVLDASSRELRSRSFKKTDGTLTSLIRRLPSARVKYSLELEDYASDSFWNFVDDIDGLGAVFSAQGDNKELTVYGFHTSVNTVARINGRSNVTVEVETL